MKPIPSHGVVHAARVNTFVPVRSGFTFLEILFSIMVLGIGFIMVAAMFPAAIRQTQANVEDQAFTSVSREAVRTLTQLARQIDKTSPTAVASGGKNKSFLDEYMQPPPNLPNPPPPGFPKVYSFNDERIKATPFYTNLWKMVSGNLIIPSDPRYAWVPMFSRDFEKIPDPTKPAGNYLVVPVAQATVYIVPVRCRTKSQYSADPTDPNCDLTMVNGASTNLEPALVQMAIDFVASPPTISLTGGGGVCSRQSSTIANPTPKSNAIDVNPIADGCWLIVSDDESSNAVNINGSIFRVGTQAPGVIDGTKWVIAPDPQNSPIPVPAKLYKKVYVFVVGRAADPDSKTPKSGSTVPTVTGPAQDLGIQTTVISFPGAPG